MSEAEKRHEVQFGTTVYTEDGEALGTVRGFDEHGFYVTAEDGVEALSIEHVRSGHEFGEAELMWRCWECGEMGALGGEFPESCPSCGADREDIYYWTED
jgi:rubrerythrin